MSRARSVSGLIAATAASVTLLAAAGQAQAQFSLGSMLPGGSFTVDGRRGTYLSQIDPGRIDHRILQEEAQGLSAEGNSIAAFEGLRLPMPRTQEALDALITRLDGGWPHDRPSMPRAFLVANNLYAPQTLPDGSIMVSMGLLIRAESDDEVAFMLAHELGHVRLGHFADDGAFRRKRQLATMIGRIYHAAIALSEARVYERGDGYQVGLDDDRRVDEERKRAAAANAALRQLITLLLERPWSRAEEDQADALAFDLVAQAGMGPAAAADHVIGNLHADYLLRAEAARHMRETLAFTMRTAVTQENAMAVANGQAAEVWSAVRNPVMQVARERLLQTAVGYLDQRHRTPEARNKGLDDYAARAYRPAPPAPEEQTDWLDAVRSLDEFQDARIVVLALQEAKTLETTDVAGALAKLQPALQTRFRTTPVVANAAARLHGLAGDVRQADRLYTVAHQSPDQSLSAFVDHAQLMVDHGRYDRAKEVVVLGVAHAGQGVDGEKPFLPVLVAASFRQRKQEEGLVYLRRCVAYEEDGLRTACTVAALMRREGQEALSPEMEARVNATVRQAEAESTMGNDIDGLLRGFGNLFGGG